MERVGRTREKEVGEPFKWKNVRSLPLRSQEFQQRTDFLHPFASWFLCVIKYLHRHGSKRKTELPDVERKKVPTYEER